MHEVGIDLGDRPLREITAAELVDTELVVTMGRSASDVCPSTWSGETRDSGLDDPDGKSIEAVRDSRDEVERRVSDHFTELLADIDGPG
jgi:arsenate reductase